VQLPALTEGQNLSLALSDLVLVVGLVLTFPSLHFRPGTWSAWHFALPIYLTASALFLGPLNRYSILNKVVGIVVLLASYALVTSNVWTWHDLTRVVRAFFAGTVTFSMLGLIRYVAGADLPFTYCQTCDVRLIAFMPDANLYGSIVVVAIAAYIALDRTVLGVVHPALRWPSAIVLISALALSSSRSAWIALAAVLIVALAIRTRRALPSLFGGAVIVGAVAFLMAGERTLQLAELAGRRHSIDSRLALIGHGIDAFFENPLIGIGLGNSHERYGQIIHNTMLWVAAELGVIGLVIFFGFLLWVAARLRDAFASASPTHRPLVVFLILGNVSMLAFSLSVEAFYQRHWWLLFALAAVASRLAAGSRWPATGEEPDFPSSRPSHP
jgi:hypothetical protein